jgi:membrane protein CcdC involved in cytochrome C biogenesis
MTGARFFKQSPDRVSWSIRTRQVHRWLGLLFTLTVIANFVEMARREPVSWVTYSPLPPLFLLMGTGLYMFALPYFTKRD